MALNVQEVAAEVLNRKVDRLDIAILEILAKAPEKTMRWENRVEERRLPPLPGAPKGAPPRIKYDMVPGLEVAANSWCDENPHLTVFEQEPIKERHRVSGELLVHPRDPVIKRCTIARLENLVAGTTTCPGLIEHLGAPDEATAAKPTRLLKLSEVGEVMLKLWYEGRIKNVPYPDPAPPTPEEKSEQNAGQAA